jgi:hypothetical protein
MTNQTNTIQTNAVASAVSPAESVAHLWTTSLLIANLDPHEILDRPAIPNGREQREVLPGDDVRDAVLAEVFAAAATRFTGVHLSASTVRVTVEIWRNAYEVPVATPSTEWAGWYYLTANPAPEKPDATGLHPDSGAVTFHDPRGGAALVTMPGLPWGRDLTVRARPGNLVIAPGWLTYSVIPLAPGQVVIAALAAPTTSR